MKATAPTTSNWYGLDWTEWIPLMEARDHRAGFPPGPGIYRIRFRDTDITGPDQLAYLGQSSRVRGRLLQDLYRPVFGNDPPWNDPHTAAPALWAYRVESGALLEVSAASAPEDHSQRRGLEDALLWRHRRATGRSVLCNYGRFHPKYRRPSNKQTGRAMTRREEPKPELNASCAPPLPLTGRPTGPDWMDLDWSSLEPFSSESTKNLPRAPGLYRIFLPGSDRLSYLGETSNLRNRLRRHARRDWDSQPRVSVVTIAEDRPDYHRDELESDLLGGHFKQIGSPPAYQYRKLPA